MTDEGEGSTGRRRRTAVPDGPRPSRGRRATANRERRRRSRRRAALVGAVVLAIAAVVAAVLVVVLGGEPDPDERDADVAPGAGALPGDPQPVLALVTVDDTPSEPQVVSIAVLAHDREADQGTLLLVPGGTVTDVPGHGSHRLADAYRFGGGALVGVTLDNLLGARIDAVATVTGPDWASLLDHVGPIEVDVPRALEPADGGPPFPAGTQVLDPDRVAALVVARAGDEAELERLPRVQRVIVALLEAVADDPALAGTLAADPALGLTVDDPQLVALLLEGLATARAGDRYTALTLPVSPIGAGTDDTYRPDAPRITQLVEDRFAASQPDDEVGAGRSLRILNGNGQPGIGAAVAERVRPGGYRVVLTGNADRFTYETTRIVVHDDAEATLAAAADLADRLGVGEVERSGTPQSVVDITIIVGADFAP